MFRSLSTIPNHIAKRRILSNPTFRLNSTTTKNDYDVVIVGGGAVGANVAYHLALLDGELSICVIERDFSYTNASAVLSAAGIRQQFSLPANIELSKYGVKFLRDAAKDLYVKGCDVPDMQFKEQGYLFLASPGNEETLRNNHQTQLSCGVDWMSILTPPELEQRFPWLKTDGVALGSMSEHSEGWFDPWALLSSLTSKAKSMGVAFIQGEVIELNCQQSLNANQSQNTGLAPQRTISKVLIRPTQNGIPCVEEGVITLGCGTVVNAAGPFAQKLAASCGEDLMRVPVEARRRSIFHIHCHSDCGGTSPMVPSYKETPLVVCPETGVYFRPEGGRNFFICGVSPFLEEHLDDNCQSYKELDVDADHSLYEGAIWPSLYDRCEALGNLKVKASWVGFYEYNTVDQNAIIGYHPEVSNLLLCNGFSGHGLQQSMGSGRAVAEIIKHKKSTSIDVSCFSFDRIAKNQPLYEQNIV